MTTDQQAATKPLPAAIPIGDARLRGVFALAIAVPMWLEGARTTRDGWVLVINAILERFDVPVVIPPAANWAWWAALGVLVGMGYAYSRVEVALPFRPPRELRRDFFKVGLWRFDRTWEIWIVWLVLVVSDVATTYVGVRSPAPDAATIFQQLAQFGPIAALYALVLTFVPERLAIYGWRRLRG